MSVRWSSVVVVATLLVQSGWVGAQAGSEASQEVAVDETATHELTTEEAVGRTLTTAAEAVPEHFLIWSGDLGFIKPILQISTVLTGYFPTREANEELANRVSTLVLGRLGFEGSLFEFASFRLVFERNMGFTFGRNGPVGTSVWEGTASWQARDSYLRLSRWGFSLLGGIFPDPASIDFVSDNILDTFGMDPFIRTPLLQSGLNQGQGFLLNYNWRWLTAGFSYTGGNPLVSSLAFPFGGDVSVLGTLFTAPLRGLSNGIPGSDIHLNVISPTLMWHSEYVDVKVAYQHYFVDTDVLSADDAQLQGFNLRGTLQIKLLDDRLRIMGTSAWRRNEQIVIQDSSQKKDDDFEGRLHGFGLDFNMGDFGVGGNYWWYRSTLNADTEFTDQYVNVGATYWLWRPFLSASARYAYAKSTTTDENLSLQLDSVHTFFVGMRLII